MFTTQFPFKTSPYLSHLTGSHTLISDFVTQMVNQMWNWRLTGSQIPTPNPVFRNFCKNVITHSDASPAIVLLALKYLQKFGKLTINNNISEFSEAKQFVVALILAHKMLEDCTYTNETWSQITGISREELNALERSFLTTLQYDVHVSQEEFSQWLLYIEQYMRHREPISRSTKSPQKSPASITATLSMWTRASQPTC
ncbi:hypothetical protein K7432_005733 [Basidiobolus ranarum]|uniref:Cyclin n=1 Tax=Basidiobolus ranarum TaxID=34480 RepID=A0ABR2WW64_9FUNG